MHSKLIRLLLCPYFVVICTAIANPNITQTWIPQAGTSHATVVEKDGHRAVKFNCNFSDTSIPRAVWDTIVKIDMTECRGIRFKLKCENLTPISSFNIYFHSGEGWYSAEFDVNSSDWHEIKIDKAETNIEGKPAGWRDIDRIRICAWRGEDKNTAFFVSDMQLLPADTGIYIVRNESAMFSSPAELPTIMSVCRYLSGCLSGSGVDYSVISEADFSTALARKVKLIILPYNPQMSDEFRKLLLAYLGNSGRLICFYLFPPWLEKTCGIMRGKYVRASYNGHFASIRRCNPDSGLPENVTQHSWNIYQAKPVDGKSEVLAYWYDESGKNTGEPAIVASSNTIVMTHIILPDDITSEKQKLLLGMIARFIPGVWEKYLKILLDEKNWSGKYQSLAEATNQIARCASDSETVLKLLKDASSARRTALSLRNAGRNMEAVEVAESGLRQMVTAYSLSQKPVDGEQRGIWCHNPAGVQGLSWDNAIRILSANGFTDIFVNMAWAGVAYYKSNVLPVAPEAEKHDFLEECLTACKKYGVRFHFWKICWNMGTVTSDEYINSMKKQYRLQIGSDGKENIRWLCPSHPANHQMEIDSVVEVVKKYKVDGIHFDYIRYPGANYCFCENCRKKFEQFVGASVPDIQKTIASSEYMRLKWREFRCSNISSVIISASKQIRALMPSVKISAAVFSDLPSAKNNVAQDWEEWCRSGYLDFVCPMNYTPAVTRFETLLSRQLKWVHGAGCYPGIGVSVWKSYLPFENVYKLLDMVNITRTFKTGGFTIFDYNNLIAKEIIPLCGVGITRTK